MEKEKVLDEMEAFKAELNAHIDAARKEKEKKEAVLRERCGDSPTTVEPDKTP